ncbi:hypothetical protein ACLOJK_037376 [Asimina triloba]
MRDGKLKPTCSSAWFFPLLHSFSPPLRPPSFSSPPTFLLLSASSPPLAPFPLRSATLPDEASPLRRRVPLRTRSEPLSVSPQQRCPPSFSGVGFLSARDWSPFSSPLRKHCLPSFSGVGFFNTPVFNVCNRFVPAVSWETVNPSYGWFDWPELLAHPALGAFSTHNGRNFTVEGISQGVPMICSPCLWDQKGLGYNLRRGLTAEKSSRSLGD